jgi:hypothetical protein
MRLSLLIMYFVPSAAYPIPDDAEPTDHAFRGTRTMFYSEQLSTCQRESRGTRARQLNTAHKAKHTGGVLRSSKVGVRSLITERARKQAKERQLERQEVV